MRLTDDYQFESEEEQEQPDTTDMPELQSEESTTQKNEGHGLKILTPNQMLSIIPISLAQLEAGNNWEKLKNLKANIVFFVQIKKTYKTNP